MATLIELQTQLAEAEKALHTLLIGKGVAQARDSNGEMVQYRGADTGKLNAYIDRLKMEIAKLTGETIPCGPMRIYFR